MLNFRTKKAEWLLAIGAVLAVLRLSFAVFNSEDGLRSLSTAIYDATSARFASKELPIQLRRPDEQAEFWLANADPILESEKNNPKVILGAAIALQEPSFMGLVSFQSSAEENDKNVLVPGSKRSFWPELDEFKESSKVFDQRCQARSIELARKAVELDPTNVSINRVYIEYLKRAHPGAMSSSEVDAFVIELMRASKIDPDNAIYDYLAAAAYWDSGSEIDQDTYKIRITDQKRHDLGTTYFEEGQRKPFVYCAEDEWGEVIFQFLDRVELSPRNEFLSLEDLVVGAYSINDFMSTFLHFYSYLLVEGADREDILKVERQAMKLFEQVEEGWPDAGLSVTFAANRSNLFGKIRDAIESNRASYSDAEAKRMEDKTLRSELETLALVEAISRENKAEEENHSLPSVWIEYLALIGWAMGPSFVGLALGMAFVSGICWLASRLSGDSKQRPGIFWHVVIPTLIAFALTFCLFGLFPAGVISRDIQRWIFTGSVFLLPLLILSAVGFAVIRRSRARFSMSFGLGLVTVVGVILGLVVYFGNTLVTIIEFPFDLWIPNLGVNGISAELAMIAFHGGDDEWFFAALQWQAYLAELTTVMLILIITLIGWLYRVRKKSEREFERHGSKTDRRNKNRMTLARGYGLLAIVFSILFLLYSVSAIQTDQSYRDESLRIGRGVREERESTKELIDQLLDDEKFLTKMKARISNRRKMMQNQFDEASDVENE